MRKPKYDPKGYVSRLQSLAKWSVLYAEHQKKPFETSIKNSTKRLVEAYQEQNEYIEYLEKELEHLKQPFNLYCVTNGWKTYDGDCYASVIAHSEEEALKLCAEEFKEHAEMIGEDESFWNNLTVELVELDEDIKRDGISLGVTYD